MDTKVIVFWLLLAACAQAQAGPAAASAQIDACQYADDAAAQSVWQPMRGTEPVSAAEADGRAALRLPCKFSGALTERASWDRKVALDLVACRGIQFQFLCRNPAPVSYFSIYFQSGEGWYHAAFFPASSAGWNVITIDKADTSVEGKPAGWGQVRTIRISAWRGQSNNTEFFLRDVRPTGVLGSDATVAIVRDESAAQRSGDELRLVQQHAGNMARSLAGLGLGCAIIGDLDISLPRLAAARLVVLPYNPSMTDAAADILVEYVRGGGKLLAFYSVPARLRPVLGVTDGRHVKAAYPGNFAVIRAAGKALPDAPATVRQRSWNINAFSPVPGRGQVRAEWLNDKNESTGFPAVLGSTNGLVMTHVLLPEDSDRKQRLLLAMVGYLVPAARSAAAETAIASIGKVSRFSTFAEAMSRIVPAGSNEPAVTLSLAAARAHRELAIQRAAESQFAGAMDEAAAARTNMLRAFCQAQVPEPNEFRAFWCHSPFGVEGMDWDATIRLLAANGFTAILPNMLWGGAAFYPSRVLPVASSVATRGDQIAQCLAACRKYGLKLHVWKVNWNLGQAAPPGFIEQLRREGRLQASVQGKEEPWLCPSHPANQRLEIDSLVEIARKYDVDGLHFDYIRYPDADHCFCAGCRLRFEQVVKAKIADWPGAVRAGGAHYAQWLQWRRQQITAVVKAVSQRARKIRPKIQLSAAVFPNWTSDRDSVGQDWRLWCSKKYMDFVCPMDYTPINSNFAARIAQQLVWAGRTPCYPGIGASASTSRLGPDQVIDQILITRRCQTRGFVIFNYGAAESRDIVPFLGLGVTAPRGDAP